MLKLWIAERNYGSFIRTFVVMAETSEEAALKADKNRHHGEVCKDNQHDDATLVFRPSNYGDVFTSDETLVPDH
jgi:hypothetical protein